MLVAPSGNCQPKSSHGVSSQPGLPDSPLAGIGCRYPDSNPDELNVNPGGSVPNLTVQVKIAPLINSAASNCILT